jgi:outer membrane lipoprotein-sorting protein
VPNRHSVVVATLAVVSAIQVAVQAGTSVPSVDEIVSRMVARNAERSAQCHSYRNLRDYHVTYRGFPGSKDADMQVEMSFVAPSTKAFRILSTSGSKFLVDRVLKKLLESEQEASIEQSHTALTPANYKFEFDGKESSGGRTLFVLRVRPKVDSKFLYKGKIWVDSQDYAVTRIDAEPSKNPSFWIKNTEIHQTYTKVGDFWFPSENQSETKVRLGGVSKLTITYSNYDIGDRSLRTVPTNASPTPVDTSVTSLPSTRIGNEFANAPHP